MSDLVVVTRRADGVRFEVIAQARSPDGTVTLRAVAPPHATHEVRGRDFNTYYSDPRKPDVVRHPPNLHVVGNAGQGFNVDHLDGASNRWSVCDCAAAHIEAQDALDCARVVLDLGGRRAFETYNHAVGGLTWDGKPIPGWESVTEAVRDGWRMASLALRHRQTLR